jgi:hypothetical protein
MKFQKQHEAHFPLGEFVHVNSKKLGTDPTFSWQIFSLTNCICQLDLFFRFVRTNSPCGKWALQWFQAAIIFVLGI